MIPFHRWETRERTVEGVHPEPRQLMEMGLGPRGSSFSPTLSPGGPPQPFLPSCGEGVGLGI